MSTILDEIQDEVSGDTCCSQEDIDAMQFMNTALEPVPETRNSESLFVNMENMLTESQPGMGWGASPLREEAPEDAAAAFLAQQTDYLSGLMWTAPFGGLPVDDRKSESKALTSGSADGAVPEDERKMQEHAQTEVVPAILPLQTATTAAINPGVAPKPRGKRDRVGYELLQHLLFIERLSDLQFDRLGRLSKVVHVPAFYDQTVTALNTKFANNNSKQPRNEGVMTENVREWLRNLKLVPACKRGKHQRAWRAAKCEDEGAYVWQREDQD